MRCLKIVRKHTVIFTPCTPILSCKNNFYLYIIHLAPSLLLGISVPLGSHLSILSSKSSKNKMKTITFLKNLYNNNVCMSCSHKGWPYDYITFYPCTKFQVTTISLCTTHIYVLKRKDEPMIYSRPTNRKVNLTYIQENTVV